MYALYQMSKALGFAYLIRGTLMYVAGQTNSVVATKRFWAAAALFGVVSAIAARHGVDELLIWQSVLAAPTLGYCAGAFLLLPRARRTAGSVSVGIGFALLTILWLLDAGAFAVSIGGGDATNTSRVLVSLNAYFELGLSFLLAYAMVLVLMEDNKREIDDAQAELRVTHDQLRRAALYDSLTDSLNRRAFAEGVGLEMVRTTFGTVVIADLDNLKWVNDRLGHAAGDQLIRHCADVLRCDASPYDKLYRWGGDEFLLIVPSARAADVVDRLRRGDRARRRHGARAATALQVSLGAAELRELRGAATKRSIGPTARCTARRRDARRTGSTAIRRRRSSGTPSTHRRRCVNASFRGCGRVVHRS